MQTIDSLGIEITADASGANNSLKDLSKNLDAVKGSLKGFDSKSFTQLATQMKQTQAAMETLVAKVKVLNGQKIKPALDTSGVNKSAKFISSETDKVRRELAGLKPIANAAMSGDSSAVSSFQRKAMAIQSSIEKIKSEFGKLGSTRIENPALTQIKEQIQQSTAKLQDLKSLESSISSSGHGFGFMGDTMVSLDDVKAKIQEVEAEIQNLKNAEQGIINSGNSTVDPFQSTRQSVAETENSLRELTGQVQNAASNVNNTEFKPKTDSGKAEIKDFLKVLGEVKSGISSATGMISKVFSGIAAPFKAAKSGLESIKGAFDKVHGFMDKGFMKILRYGFGIRSLYVLFRRLKQAIIDSFGELQKSGAFVQETKTNIEGLKASLTTLKFQFGAAFQPIFNAIAPALQTLINYLVSVMNVISAFTAKLMGKSTYSKAVASTGAIAGNMGSAAGSAKELNKQLQGFDELNNLTSNSPGGGGGGGGGGGAGSGANYVTESVDSVLGDFAKELAEKIKQGDWYGVGRAISDKLVEAMQSIDWNKIYEKARNFGRGLAEFLNGLITPELFGELGKTLANALNTAFYGLLEFAKTFDWNNLGESIATGINEFFTNADFAAWGETVHEWIGGILDAGIALVDNTNFELIGEKLADFFNNLDPADILGKAAVLFHKLWKGLKELFGSLWKNLGKDIKQGIKDYVLDAVGFLIPSVVFILNAENIISLIFDPIKNAMTKGLYNVGTAIGTAISNIKTTLSNAWNTLLNGGGTTTGYNGMPSDVANKQFGTKSLADYGANILKGIRDGFTKALSAFNVVKDLWDKIVDDFKTIFGIESPAKKMKPYGANILYGIIQGFREALKKSGGIVSELWGLFTGNGRGSQWSNNGKESGANFEITISGVVDSLLGIDNLKSKYNNLKTAWQGRVADFKTNLRGVVDSLSGITNLTSIYNKLRTGWTGAKSTFTTTVGGQISKIVDLDTWANKITNLRDKWKSKKATFESGVGGQIAKIGDLDTWGGKITGLYKKWVGRNASFGFSSNTSPGGIDGYTNAISKLNSAWTGKSASFSISANINDDIVQDMIDRINRARIKLEDALNRIPNSVRMRTAKGSIITPNSYESFARGGSPDSHGTMFLAGEAGPEIVGHVGNRTEVLNKSQLASVMVNAVRLGMQSVYPSTIQMEIPKTNYNTYTASSYSADNYSESIARQNALLEEQNRLLQEIADKDPNIKVQDVFDATRKGAREYYSRTGNSPFLF